MTVYVLRNGRLVDKRQALLDDEIGRASRSLRDDMLCTPMISRMEPYESPVTGEEITSWRQRDADMRAVDAYDPRDMPPGHVYSKGRQSKEATDARPDDTFQWRSPDE